MKLKYRTKNPQKQGKFQSGGGEELLWLARIYTPDWQLLRESNIEKEDTISSMPRIGSHFSLF